MYITDIPKEQNGVGDVMELEVFKKALVRQSLNIFAFINEPLAKTLYHVMKGRATIKHAVILASFMKEQNVDVLYFCFFGNSRPMGAKFWKGNDE